jgi:TolB-like protein
MRFGLCMLWAACAAILSLGSIAAGDTAAAGKPTIAVMPFDVLGDTSRVWLGKAFQEGLSGNFQQSGMQTSDTAPGADFVVTGSVQVVGDQMRVAGKISNAAGNQVIGRFRSDGPVRDLFDIEDAMASKAERLVKPSSARAGPAPAIQPVGGTLSTSVSRYFDGNIAATLAVPDEFQDEYNRVNYHPTQWYWGYGYPWYGGYGYGFAWGYFPWNVGRYGISIAAPLSTW